MCVNFPQKRCENIGALSPNRVRTARIGTARWKKNLKLFEGMKNGEFDEGTYVLRAKIDMASPNINLRDPIIYRIKKWIIPERGENGVFIPCMTSPMVFLMPLKG